MTRKEILLLAAVLAKEEDDIVSLAHEIADFLLVDEEENGEEELPQKAPFIPTKIEDRVKGRMWNMPEELNIPPRESAAEIAKKNAERVKEIIEKIANDDKDEFYVDPKRVPTEWEIGLMQIPGKKLHTGVLLREPENKKPEKNRSPWKKEDLEHLDEMLKAGSSFKEIAINLKRSEKAIETVVQKLASGYPVGRRADK